MPARPPKELVELLGTYDRGVQELALSLREVVIEEMAPCWEQIYEVYTISVVYGSTQKAKDAVLYVAVSKDHVNLGFFRGARLSNRHRLFEGEGKQMRHIKIRGIDDVENPALRDYIQEACERAGHFENAGPERTVSTAVKRKGQEKRILGVKLL